MSWAEDDWERRVPPVQVSLTEAARILEGTAVPLRLTQLNGGKANTNVRVDTTTNPLVLRVIQRDAASAEREELLAEKIAGVVPSPTLRGRGRTEDGLPVLVFDFVEGRTPADVMATDPTCAWEVGHALGDTLARLTEVPIDGMGLYASDLSLSRRFDTVGESFVDLVQWSLSEGRAGRRLSPQVKEALEASLPRAAERLAALDAHPALAHGDYKSSNLLLARTGGGWGVAAVLDWEFACPFTPMLDVAILMRHRASWPLAFQEGFETGYRGRAWLPDDWRQVSRVVDLMNLVGFLNAAGDRPRLYDRVTGLLTATLGGM